MGGRAWGLEAGLHHAKLQSSWSWRGFCLVLVLTVGCSMLFGWLGGRAVQLLVHSKQVLVGKASPRCCQNAAKHHPDKSDGPEVGVNLVSSSSSSDVF